GSSAVTASARIHGGASVSSWALTRADIAGRKLRRICATALARACVRRLIGRCGRAFQRGGISAALRWGFPSVRPRFRRRAGAFCLMLACSSGLCFRVAALAILGCEHILVPLDRLLRGGARALLCRFLCGRRAFLPILG